MPEHTTYRLVPPATAAAHRIGTPVDLDADQRRVVDHESGPLLVLAGPGTGKTTTLVEAIADRIERRGADPSQVLALTFSRKAAESKLEEMPVLEQFIYGICRESATPDQADQAYRFLRERGTATPLAAELRGLCAADAAKPYAAVTP